MDINYRYLLKESGHFYYFQSQAGFRRSKMHLNISQRKAL